MRARLLTAVLLAASAVVGSVVIPGASAQAPTAVLPAQLVALEQKMEQLQINSERFSLISRGRVTVTNESNGKPDGPPKYVSLDQAALGEASLQPSEGEILFGKPSRPRVILIGSTLYVHEPSIAKRDGHRPWVRLNISHGATSGPVPVFPYHRESGEETGPGSGSYAALINLLGTAVGPVSVGGTVSIQGQASTEFTAMVEPLELDSKIPPRELALLRRHVPPRKLEVFITESGLPLRVVSSLVARDITSVQTTEILAVNVPVSVQLPPARETIGQAQLSRLESRRHSNGGPRK
jgi:hypothetical protein